MWFTKSTIPFSAPQLWLIQVDRDALSSEGRQLMRLAFPGFLEPEAYRSDFREAVKVAYGDENESMIPVRQSDTVFQLLIMRELPNRSYGVALFLRSFLACF